MNTGIKDSNQKSLEIFFYEKQSFRWINLQKKFWDFGNENSIDFELIKRKDKKIE